MMLALVLAVVVKVEAVSSPTVLCEKLKETSLQTLMENVLYFSVSFLLKVENFLEIKLQWKTGVLKL